MSKYSNEFKLRVIKYCLEENHSQKDAERYFNIPKNSRIKIWIQKYREHGIEGLIKHQKSSYSGKFKQNVIEYMHSNRLSATETANHFRLAGPDVVLKWERIYYEEGPQGLYIERRGRSKKMSSNSKNKKIDKQFEEDLIAENQRLKMEVEYLKKLNALVQERIKRENKKK